LKPYKLNTGVTLQERDISDLQLTVEGLTHLFTKFLYKYATNSADIILIMLMNHLKYHYEQPIVLEHLYLIRFVVITRNNFNVYSIIYVTLTNIFTYILNRFLNYW